MPVDEDDFKRVIGNMVRMPPKKHSEDFKRFDKAMGKILSVSKEELNRRLAEAKKNETGKRYT